MGRCEWRTWPGLRPSMAFLAQRAWRHRPDRQPYCRHQAQPGFAKADRDGVESGRCAEDGVAALSLSVSILRGERKTELPALPAFGRYFPWRAVQHRFLRSADIDGGAGDGAKARRV